MTEIKAGTRVTATCVAGVEEITGVLLEKGQMWEHSDERSVLPDDNLGPDSYRYVRADSVKAVSTLAFIGPKPEPVKEPKVVLPFAVSHGIRGIVVDANGEDILTVSGVVTTDAEDKELAALVVRLLNKHFGVE